MIEQVDGSVRIAERVKTALEAADLSAFSDLLDPNVTWGAPGDRSPECQNRAQVLAWYQRGRESGTRAQVLEIVVLGDRLLVGLSVTGNSVAPASDGTTERWQLLSLAGGRIVDIRGFQERDEAVAHATGAVAPGNQERSHRWVPPQSRLADDQIEVRLPNSSDADALHDHASQAGGLEGMWLPLAEGASLQDCEAVVADWLAGWRNEPSFHGPALVIVKTGRSELIGHVGLADRGEQQAELVYGVAPHSRRHGYASAAVRLVSRWLLQEGLASAIELRIDRPNIGSQKVAAKAGFQASGTIISQVKATGESYEDLRFVLAGVRSE
jgi:RimJ/RimL family protein N-acetyltransferase/ketosteroid isomerase-like protein